MAVALAAASPGLAAAADVRVVVNGLRSAAGNLLVAVCGEEDFLGRGCDHTGRAPARRGEVTVSGVPVGVYAVQAVHDENANQRIDLGFARRPLEGIGFSRDAPMRFGPPRFADAAIEVSDPGGTLSLNMRYFQ